ARGGRRREVERPQHRRRLAPGGRLAHGLRARRRAAAPRGPHALPGYLGVTTYLVTGAAGFIGSALVRLLASGGAARVVGVDALTYAADLERLRPAGAGSGHRFVQLDVNDQAAMLELLREEQPAAVIHLAAETHVDRSIDGPRQFVQANTVGTFNLLEA